MDRHHINEEQMVAMHYGDVSADERTLFDRHLATCDACQASFEEMRSVLAMVSAQPVPEPADDFERRVWQRVIPQLPVRQASWWSFVLQPQKLALAGAIALLLLLAFVVGRQWPMGGTPNQTAQKSVNPDAVRDQLLLAAVSDHIDRSQRVLSELVNSPDTRADISSEQETADDLVLANRLYRQTATNSGDKQLVAMLDELERTLLDIARSPEKLSKAEMEGLRKRIAQRQLVFKLRVVGEQVHEQQKEKVRDRSRQMF